jgi:hypothetical protein
VDRVLAPSVSPAQISRLASSAMRLLARLPGDAVLGCELVRDGDRVGV